MKFGKKKTDEKKTEIQKVEERREEILAQGRKFKYPLQYTKHRVIVNTILISVAIFGIVFVFGWFALYRAQMTDELLYNVTEILPISVATVDGERVRFSDYLMFYRSSIVSIEQQSSGGDDIESMRTQYKRDALTKAEVYSYALGIAKKDGITILNEEVDAEFERQRQVGGIDRSKEGFLKIIEDNFGMSESEYRRMLYLTIMKAKVEEKIDLTASRLAERADALIVEKNGDFEAVANGLGEAVQYEKTGGLVDNKNIDGGRATEATKLEVGARSGRFVSLNGDGYYYVKLLNKTDSEVNFESLFIPFSEFDARFQELVANDRVKEFISLE